MQNNSITSANEQTKDTKTAKDISEIEQMLIAYQQTGYLDRDKAIKKLCGARFEEPAVQAALMPKNPLLSVPYEKVPDFQLANQLSFVREYLSSKLIADLTQNS